MLTVLLGLLNELLEDGLASLEPVLQVHQPAQLIAQLHMPEDINRCPRDRLLGLGLPFFFELPVDLLLGLLDLLLLLLSALLVLLLPWHRLLYRHDAYLGVVARLDLSGPVGDPVGVGEGVLQDMEGIGGEPAVLVGFVDTEPDPGHERDPENSLE